MHMAATYTHFAASSSPVFQPCIKYNIATHGNRLYVAAVAAGTQLISDNLAAYFCI